MFEYMYKKLFFESQICIIKCQLAGPISLVLDFPSALQSSSREVSLGIKKSIILV